MTDTLHHECGIVLIRLRKPLSFYQQKYGTPLYGLYQLQAMMQKLQNRGQDGAGMATIKLDTPPGVRYISRKRNVDSQSLRSLFEEVFAPFGQLSKEQIQNADYLKNNLPYAGEVLMGHLRYGTHGINSIETCHPFLRQNNWKSRNLIVAGNFNLTNVDELFGHLVALGQHPKERADTVTIMERIGHFLDREVQALFEKYKNEGMENSLISEQIEHQLDLQRILQQSAKKFDGGYVIGGMIGTGAAFALRDPKGIRPAFYYQNDEVVVMASERPAIQTVFEAPFEEVRELTPGHALIIQKNGDCQELPVLEREENRYCAFEAIYFSRDTDRDIYQERQRLGYQLAPRVLEAVQGDVENTVFAYVPNTAETAFFGLLKGVEDLLNERKKEQILALGDRLDANTLGQILQRRMRVEKIITKDVKQRTFITQDSARVGTVSRVYDTVYGIIRPGQDTLVLLDDSIVRGTTLRESLIRMLARLRPKKVIVVSSAPQIRYPDCYGIDMSKFKDLIAFNALVEILKDRGQDYLIDQTYAQARYQLTLPKEQIINTVQELYGNVSEEEVSQKIAQMLTPPGMPFEVQVIYQSLEGLQRACPQHSGDWCFSGNFPTQGGMRVVNRAFINYKEGVDARAY